MKGLGVRVYGSGVVSYLLLCLAMRLVDAGNI
jgi:hypothetical protein